MSSAIDDFYDFHKDVATYYNVLVDINLSDHRINIIVRSKERPLRLCGSFYCQDAYKQFEESDDIYHWIAEAVEQVK